MWPALPLDQWRDTRDTLQMWMQMAGKVCLALTPRVNHFWNIAFHLTPRGIITPLMWQNGRTFTVLFDLTSHAVVIEMSDGNRETIPLRPETVAAFYQRFMDTLHRMGVDVRIWTMPVEVEGPIRFTKDETHRSYDAAAAHTFHQVLLAIAPVLQQFRAEFIGKCSPVHFFWGSFDLAVTRFSGRPAPPRENADAITREAYSHEVISFGFWPGDDNVPDAAFYSYTAPEPEGLRDQPLAVGSWTPTGSASSLAILPYDEVRTSDDPRRTLLAFCESAYEAGARLAGWDTTAFTSSACPAPDELRELQATAAGQFGRAVPS